MTENYNFDTLDIKDVIQDKLRSKNINHISLQNIKIWVTIPKMNLWDRIFNFSKKRRFIANRNEVEINCSN